jgi:type II secretory pathway component PulF
MFRHRERFVKFLIFFVVGAMVISLVAGVILTLFGNG